MAENIEFVSVLENNNFQVLEMNSACIMIRYSDSFRFLDMNTSSTDFWNKIVKIICFRRDSKLENCYTKILFISSRWWKFLGALRNGGRVGQVGVGIQYLFEKMSKLPWAIEIKKNLILQ